MINKLCEHLLKTKTTIAIAESCTGGLLSSMLVEYPGISEVYLCGTVAYSNKAKITRLNVDEEIINSFGAVSTQCACAMAEGARAAINSDIGISTTGIAGPGGGSDEKPVGLVYVGISLAGRTEAYRLELSGCRKEIMLRASREAVLLLCDKLSIK